MKDTKKNKSINLSFIKPRCFVCEGLPKIKIRSFATNVLAQTNNLDEILKSTKLLLDEKGLLIIEVQYLYDLLAQKGFDSFHPEHIQYYTLSSITKVLDNYNLYIWRHKNLLICHFFKINIIIEL